MTGFDTATGGAPARSRSAPVPRPSDAGPRRVQEVRERDRASSGVGHRSDELPGGAALPGRGCGSSR